MQQYRVIHGGDSGMKKERFSYDDSEADGCVLPGESKDKEGVHTVAG